MCDWGVEFRVEWEVGDYFSIFVADEECEIVCEDVIEEGSVCWVCVMDESLLEAVIGELFELCFVFGFAEDVDDGFDDF